MIACRSLIDETRRAGRKLLVRDIELLSNAAALSTGTVFSSVLGFVYWVLAVRLFPADVVGIVAAAIALSSFVGLVGDFGLGTMLMGEAERPGKDASGLISASLFASASGGILAGVVALAVVHGAGLEFGDLLRQWPHEVLFVLACALTSFSLTLDQAFVGLLKARQQMLRNLVFSVLKIVFLVPLILAPDSNLTVLIFNAWMLASLASVLFILEISGVIPWTAWRRPLFVQLMRRQREAIAHHLLNIAAQTPRLVMPVVVEIQLGAAINAVFYPALTITNIVLLVPAALTTVLFATGSKAPEKFVSQLRTTLAISVIGSVLSVIGFYLFGPLTLSFINPDSSTVLAPSFMWFGFLVAGLTVKMHYIAIGRLRDRMLAVSGIVGLLSLLEVTAAWLGARIGGIEGLTIGWLTVVLLGAAALYPTIERERRGHG
jgi:O-antigen/teichoic acid export membrane protein